MFYSYIYLASGGRIVKGEHDFGPRGRCPQYVFLDGAMTKTIPTCSANIISWKLMDESIPAQSPVRFMVQVQRLCVESVRKCSSASVRKLSKAFSGFYEAI